MRRRPKDLTGQHFGALTVQHKDYLDSHGDTHWLCICECRKQTSVIGSNLTSGNTSSCGCLRGNPTHGESASVEYRAWIAMKYRCFAKDGKDYKNYGGRGITVCDRWGDYNCFLADMGRKPGPEYSLDRINNDGNYDPWNCRWATTQEQRHNKRSVEKLYEDNAKQRIPPPDLSGRNNPG